MTHSQGHTTSDGADDAGMVTLKVEIRAEHAALLRRFASREGASVEALASLWLEEKLDEAMRSSSRPPAGHESGGGE
jgi:hypothetical protein